MNLHSISTCYVASRILHPVFRPLVQKLHLQPGRGSGKATEMEHLSREESLGELDLVSLELRMFLWNLVFVRGWPESFHP